MSSNIPLPPREQLYNRYCSIKHTHTTRSPAGWDQIPRWAGGWVLHPGVLGSIPKREEPGGKGRIRIASYVQMSLHTCYNLFHTYRYCFIPAHVISSVHTYQLLYNTCTCHFIPARTCFIRLCIVSYLHMSFHTCDNLFYTYRYCFIPAHVIFHFQLSYL